MTFCVRAIVVFYLSLCWAGSCFYAQSAQLDFRQYNTDDGLPSSETYTIMEDHSGYLWIGTDNGVARFDGYEFKVFDADDGLEDMVVFGIEEDHKGRIWISTISGRIYYYEDGKFQPFEHNRIIEDIKRSKHLGVLIDVTDDEELILSFKNAGFLKVSPSGKTEWLLSFSKRDVYLYKSIDDGLLTSSSPAPRFFPSCDEYAIRLNGDSCI